jgi:hypothetical protein
MGTTGTMTTGTMTKLLALREGADTHGDTAQVALCDAALAGDTAALARCKAALKSARAASTGTASTREPRRRSGWAVSRPIGSDHPWAHDEE